MATKSPVFSMASVLALWIAAVPTFSQTRLLREPSISQKTIVFVYAGDLWTAPRAGGLAARITNTPEPESTPRLSPDGSRIAFGRRGDVYVIPVKGGSETRLTWHPAQDSVAGWTPDGRQLLIQSSRLRGDLTSHPHLFLLPASGGSPEPLPIPRGTFGSFAPDGKRLAYSPTPEMVLWTPWKLYRGGALGHIAVFDLETKAFRELPRTSANDVYPMWHGDGIYFASDRGGAMNLYRYDLVRGETRRLTEHREWDVRNPSIGGGAILYENGGWLYELNLQDHSTRQVTINLPADALPGPEDRAKWQRALEDAWQTYHDRAFSPPPGWETIKPRYVELMRWASHWSDAEYVLKEMLGEARQSHVTLQRSDPPQSEQTGLLGADFKTGSGFYQVVRIYGSESPLWGRVEPGEYLLAINGRPLRETEDMSAALVGLAGKEATVTVNRVPSMDGARTVTVRTVPDERGLRYGAWVKQNAARVAEATAGRVGYLHVPNVDQPGVDGFRKEWIALRGKVQGVIIDVRNNSGGVQPEAVWDWIARKPVKLMYDQKGRVPPSIGPYLDVPKVMIANDQSASGGDELAFYFKREKIGPLVGTRTLGGMIGQGEQFPVTGGWSLGIPQYGFYWLAPEEWAPENRGVEPDYPVELRPWPTTGGRDPQLEKAIQLSLDAIQTYRLQVPVPPAYRPVQ